MYVADSQCCCDIAVLLCPLASSCSLGLYHRDCPGHSLGTHQGPATLGSLWDPSEGYRAADRLVSVHVQVSNVLNHIIAQLYGHLCPCVHLCVPSMGNRAWRTVGGVCCLTDWLTLPYAFKNVSFLSSPLPSPFFEAHRELARPGSRPFVQLPPNFSIHTQSLGWGGVG